MSTFYSQRTKASLGGVPVCGRGSHMQRPRIFHSQLLNGTEMKSDCDARTSSGGVVNPLFPRGVCKRADCGEGSAATRHALGSEPSR